MKPERMIAGEIKSRGMSIKFLSERTGVPYGRLQPSLSGNRELRADEFLSICSFLQIDPKACLPV